MARVTVEDCLGTIKNRFHLVLAVAKRAQQLMSSSAASFVELDDDKAVVLALREVAAGYVHIDRLGVAHIQSPQPLPLSEGRDLAE